MFDKTMKKLIYILILLMLTACTSNTELENLTKENASLSEQISLMEEKQKDLETKIQELENKPLSNLIMDELNNFNFNQTDSSIGGIYVLNINDIPERVLIIMPEKQTVNELTNYDTLVEGTIYVFNSHLIERYKNEEEKVNAKIESTLIKQYKFNYHFNKNNEINNENQLDLFYTENSIDSYTNIVDEKGNLLIKCHESLLFWAKFLFQKEVYLNELYFKKMGDAYNIETADGDKILLF